MAMPAQLQSGTPLEAILRPADLENFCRRWRVSMLELYGSAASGELRSDSDLDFLVSFVPDADWSLLDQVRMKQDLEALTGRKVDLMTRRALEQSPNRLLRDEILATSRVVYSADEVVHATG
jgi:uncharacterized protein